MTIKELENEIYRMDRAQKRDSDDFRMAVVLMAATQVGTTQKALIAFTGYPKRLIQTVWHRARRNGIFSKGKVACGWFEKDGGIAFWCDVAVIQGLLQRSRP